MPYLDDNGVEYLVEDLKEKTDAAYQATLVSGTNIKTVNGSSILGSGDLTISGGSTTTWYGTCSTAAGTAAKVVTCAGFELVKGAIISVLFSQQNTVGSLTMNVNSTGAVGVRISATSINTTSNSLRWATNTLVTFIYDGTYFEYISARNVASSTSTDGSGSWYGTSSTTATTATKTCSSATMLSYRLTPGAVVHIKFSNANTYVAGALSLNISSTGVYDIWVNNAVTSSSNTLTWDAGEVLTFVYGDSAYHFVCKSKAEVYTLPTASTTTLGGVKVDGDSITIDSNGVISAASQLPPVSASDNDKVLTVVSGAWAAATASGGGVSITYATVNIATSDWSNNTCTKTLSGVTANSGILATYAPASKAVYTAADIYCSAQAANSLTFTCGTVPTAAVVVNVMIIEGGAVAYSLAVDSSATAYNVEWHKSVGGTAINYGRVGTTIYLRSTSNAFATSGSYGLKLKVLSADSTQTVATSWTQNGSYYYYPYTISGWGSESGYTLTAMVVYEAGGGDN